MHQVALYIITDCDKYITNQELSKLTAEDFAARLKDAKLATKNYIYDFVKKADWEILKNMIRKFLQTKQNT